MKIAFILSKFPCYDEAFILREISALSEKMEVLIFSLRKSKEKTVHHEAEALMKYVLHVPYFFSLKLIWAQIAVFASRPIRYLRALGELIFGNISSPNFLFKSLAFFPKAVYLSHVILRKNINHMHAYWATYPASVALVAWRITGVTFSFTGHAHDIYLDTTHLKEKMIHATFVSTCTNQNRNHLKRIAPGYPDRKILVNYHGVELQKYETNGKARNSVFEILSVGTLQTHKGFQYLLHALDILKGKFAFHCTIVGGGPLEADLKKHIQMLGLGELVTMTGPLRQNEVLPYYKESDLFVLMAQPEWHWGIPNVIIEALAAKTPVITTRFGSVEELIIDGATGVIVPPKDPKRLADQIGRLAHDEDLRSALAYGGYKQVTGTFDLHKNIERFSEKLLHETNLPVVA